MTLTLKSHDICVGLCITCSGMETHVCIYTFICGYVHALMLGILLLTPARACWPDPRSVMTVGRGVRGEVAAVLYLAGTVQAPGHET